jgi:hypothetical protein
MENNDKKNIYKVLICLGYVRLPGSKWQYVFACLEMAPFKPSLWHIVAGGNNPSYIHTSGGYMPILDGIILLFHLLMFIVFFLYF